MSLLVTPVTVSSVTTAALYAVLSLIMIVTLVILLIQKQVVATSARPWSRTVAMIFNVAIVPLILVFSAIFLFNLAQLVS